MVKNNIFKNLKSQDRINPKKFIIILLNLFIFSACSQKIFENLIFNNEIILIISGSGDKSILSESWEIKIIPNQIYIDGTVQNYKDTKVYNLNEGTYEIKMEWNDTIINCRYMFKDLTHILSIDLSKFDSSKLNDAAAMFENCENLNFINFTNFNTSLVKFMDFMFSGCKLLNSLDLTSFNTLSVTNMRAMFRYCYSLNNLNLSNFNTPSVIYTDFMFQDCIALNTLDLSKFETSNVQNMNGMFYNCKSLISLDLSNFNISLVNTMNTMFKDCSSLITLDLSNFNQSNVSNIGGMFQGCSSLKTLNLSNFDSSHVASMDYMFAGCKSLALLDLTNFDTSSVKNMEQMFAQCYSLKYIDLKNFNTSSVTNMNKIFQDCRNLTSLDLSNFKTSKTENFVAMFERCYSLKTLNISNFDSSHANSMGYMFSECKSLVSLDLSNFNTLNINNMEYMFNDCSSLKILNLNNFQIKNGIVVSNMFNNCNKSMIYCINTTLEQINIQLSNYRNKICSENCFMNENNKIIYEKLECIDNCKNDNTYKFEYENICYEYCPNGTHEYSNNNLCEKDLICPKYYNNNHTECIDYIPEGYYLNYTTIYKCDIKCGNCSLESIQKDLCISCNYIDNYFPKFNDSSNFNTFINCYNSPQEGYYLDNEKQIYIPDTAYILENSSNQILDTNYNYNLDNIETTYHSNEVLNDYIFYDANLDINELLNTYKNKTFIQINQETYQFLLDKFNLSGENIKIFIKMEEYPSNDPRQVTDDYNYKFILENGMELDLNEIKEDFYVDVSLPIRNLDAANFYYTKYFSKKGFDIYDKNGDFYNNYCSPVSINGNDIIIKDRKKDIYPNNITLCKENCNYSSVNVEEERIICSCNLFINKNYSNNENDDFLKEDEGNFISYLLDYINYKIFKCYKLLLNFENIKTNFSFYTILCVFVTIIILDFIFYFYSIKILKTQMLKELPSPNKKKSKITKYIKIQNI